MRHLSIRWRKRGIFTCACCLLFSNSSMWASEEAGEAAPRTLESEVVLPPGLWLNADTSAVEPVEPDTGALDGAQAAPEPIPSAALSLPPPLDPPPLTDVSVILDWYPSPQHAALLIAIERELFEAQGLSIDLQSPADPLIGLKLLVAEEVDLALTRAPILHLQAHAGEPLVRVGTLIETPLNAVIVTGEAVGQRDIDAIAALDYGVSTREGERIVTERLIPQSLRQTDRFSTPANVHFDAAAAVVRGDVQVIADGFYTTLPGQLASEGIDTQVIRYEEIDIPRHEGLVVVANAHSLSPKGPTWARFMTAVEQANHWMIENPQTAWTLLTERYPILNNPANQSGWEALLGRVALSPAAVNTRRYRAFEAYLLKRGITEQVLPVSRLAVDPHALAE